MNTPTLEWILGIAGVVIMLLLGTNGYWIKRLVASIDLLKETVIELQKAFGIQETEFQSCKDSCAKTSAVVDQRLNDHSRTLKNHGEAIAGIKAHIKYKDVHEDQ